MADLDINQTGALRLGRRDAVEIVSLTARRGAEAALAARMQERLGVALPTGAGRSLAEGLCVLGVGPRRWLIVREGVDTSFEPDLARDLAGLAAVCLQSDAYVVFEVSGQAARAALAKGPPIDLHPRAFGLTDVAVTIAAHIGLVLWQVDDAPTYDLAVYRSYSHDFWNRLCESAAEFGFQPESMG